MSRRCFSFFAMLPLLVMVGNAAQLPRKAPELPITLPDGKPVQLSQYKGKVIAVSYILTTCPHCQKTIGFLTKMQSEFGLRGFQVVASAIEQGASARVVAFSKQFNTTFPVGFSDVRAAIDWMQHPPMLTPMMPMLAFIDRQGNVRAQFEATDKDFFNDQQEQNIRKQIEVLVNEGAGRHAPK